MKHKTTLTIILFASLGLIIVTFIAVQNDPILVALEDFLLEKLRTEEPDLNEFPQERLSEQALEDLRATSVDDESHSTMFAVAMPTEWDYIFTLGNAWGMTSDDFIGIRADGSLEVRGFEDMDASALGFWELIAGAYPTFVENVCREQLLEQLLDSTLTIGGDEFEAVEVIEDAKP